MQTNYIMSQTFLICSTVWVCSTWAVRILSIDVTMAVRTAMKSLANIPVILWRLVFARSLLWSSLRRTDDSMPWLQNIVICVSMHFRSWLHMCCFLVQVYLCTCTWSLATFFMPVPVSLFSSPAVSLSFTGHTTSPSAGLHHYWCQCTDFCFQQLFCRAVGFMHLHYWCPSAGLCESCTTIIDANLQIPPFDSPSAGL